jgi:hypothetical protein
MQTIERIDSSVLFREIVGKTSRSDKLRRRVGDVVRKMTGRDSIYLFDQSGVEDGVKINVYHFILDCLEGGFEEVEIPGREFASVEAETPVVKVPEGMTPGQLSEWLNAHEKRIMRRVDNVVSDRVADRYEIMQALREEVVNIVSVAFSGVAETLNEMLSGNK